MNRYFIRKILKNALICFFACWVVYFIREQAKGYIALAALHFTVSGAEEIYADGEPVTGKNAEVRRWFFTFRNIRTGYTDSLGIIFLSTPDRVGDGGRQGVYRLGKRPGVFQIQYKSRRQIFQL